MYPETNKPLAFLGGNNSLPKKILIAVFIIAISYFISTLIMVIIINPVFSFMIFISILPLFLIILIIRIINYYISENKVKPKLNIKYFMIIIITIFISLSLEFKNKEFQIKTGSPFFAPKIKYLISDFRSHKKDFETLANFTQKNRYFDYDSVNNKMIKQIMKRNLIAYVIKYNSIQFIRYSMNGFGAHHEFHFLYTNTPIMDSDCKKIEQSWYVCERIDG